MLSDPGYSRLKEFIIEQTGMSYYADKDGDLIGRINRRMSALGMKSCNSYIDLLKDDSQKSPELDLLIAHLTIGETHFFRYAEQFDAICNTILPDLMDRRRSTRRLHIWSAGCSNGAEAYSIAILLHQRLGPELEGWNVSILGTDINRTFLAQAMDGIYDEWALRAIPDAYRYSCFTPEANRWSLRACYRERVHFQYHNLVRHPFPSLVNDLSSLDLVLCRNVLIYFGPEMRQKILAQFHDCLEDGGWLLLGHAESSMELAQRFTPVSAPGTILYHKQDSCRAAAPAARPYPPQYQITYTPAPANPGANGIRISRPEEKSLPPGLPASQRPPVTATEPVDLGRVMSLADRGFWAEADRCCRQLIETDKLNPRTYFFQALIQEKVGSDEAAEQSLRKAIYLDRSYVLAHYHLGLFLQKSGRLRESLRAFENVLDLVSRVPPDHVFQDGDGLRADDLRELVEMQLEVFHRS